MGASTTAHSMLATCGRCGRTIVREPDGTVFCVRCATPRWWHNVASLVGDPRTWGKGVLWTVGAVLVAFGTLIGWGLLTAGLHEVVGWAVSDSFDWYFEWWVAGAIIIPGLCLEVGYAWVVAAVLRCVLGERRAGWFAPLWVAAVGVFPLLVAFVWRPDYLGL